MAKALQVENVYKSFKIGIQETTILRNLSFSVENGQFLSIMGPSGCGKSTLLYLLGGLDNPSKGSISIDGKDYSSMSEKEKSRLRRRKVGFVFQFYNLVQNLNVEDNILLPLLLDGKRASDYSQKLKDILEITNMSARAKYYPNELSGGQQQRVAIARALIFDPDIILADEPIGNLDSKSGFEIMNLFGTVNKEFHKTIVQVTHSVEASKYSSRLIKLKDGEITEDTPVICD